MTIDQTTLVLTEAELQEFADKTREWWELLTARERAAVRPIFLGADAIADDVQGHSYSPGVLAVLNTVVAGTAQPRMGTTVYAPATGTAGRVSTGAGERVSLAGAPAGINPSGR